MWKFCLLLLLGILLMGIPFYYYQGPPPFPLYYVWY